MLDACYLKKVAINVKIFEIILSKYKQSSTLTYIKKGNHYNCT
jgi:hypothetical protein